MGRRDKARYSARVSGCVWCLIQLWLLARVSAKTDGFISIDCGLADHPYHDQEGGFLWEPDSPSVLPNLNATNSTHVQSGGLYLPEMAMQTLRYFPAESAPVKSCFVLPVTTSNVYLVRAGFFYGKNDLQWPPDNQFQISLESTVWQNITLADIEIDRPLYIEAITPSLESSVLNVCLIRTGSTSTPFINSLELMPLESSMYQSWNPSLEFQKIVNLYLVQRVNFGERNKTVRYPEDPYDRRWPPYLDVYKDLEDVVTDISHNGTINGTINETARDQPPDAVMLTAITAPDFNYSYTKGILPGNTYSMSMFYAELNASLSAIDSRIIQISPSYYAAGEEDNLNLTSVGPPLTAVQWGGTRTLSAGTVTMRIKRNSRSTLDPIINADELYRVVTCDSGTNRSDVAALTGLKTALGLLQWTGDPCLPASWDELLCSSVKQVTSLNLSRKHLRGNIPAADIAGLGALTGIDLSNNKFSGRFPDFALLHNLKTL